MSNNQETRKEYLELNFIKQIWYSMTKFERYPELAASGVKRAISYFTKLILIFSIVFTTVFVYYASNVAQFEEENLNLSQKIINILLDKNEGQNEQIQELKNIANDDFNVEMIISLFISTFICFYIITLLDVITLSVLGIITCLISRIKMNYKAIFNMSIYALTLSIILKMIYQSINLLTNYEIKYFDIMYVAVAYISLAAAIFLIKSNIIKQHLELMKIIQDNKNNNEENNIPLDNPKDEDQEKNDNEKDEEKDNESTEEQGSNA